MYENRILKRDACNEVTRETRATAGTYTGVNNFWGATKIYSGYLVNSSLTPGFVKVSNNSKVTYEANYGIELSAGFEVDLNGKFEIIPRDSNCY